MSKTVFRPSARWWLGRVVLPLDLILAVDVYFVYRFASGQMGAEARIFCVAIVGTLVLLPYLLLECLRSATWDITIAAEGIWFKGSNLRWKEIRAIRTDDSRLTIYSDNKEYSVDTSRTDHNQLIETLRTYLPHVVFERQAMQATKIGQRQLAEADKVLSNRNSISLRSSNPLFHILLFSGFGSALFCLLALLLTVESNPFDNLSKATLFMFFLLLSFAMIFIGLEPLLTYGTMIVDRQRLTHQSIFGEQTIGWEEVEWIEQAFIGSRLALIGGGRRIVIPKYSPFAFRDDQNWIASTFIENCKIYYDIPVKKCWFIWPVL